MTDNEILSLMRETPSLGQRALFDKYYSYVFSIVNRIINGFGSADDSEECVIDVFASVMMKLVPDDDCSLKSYIGAVARNSAISMRRSLAAKTGKNISLVAHFWDVIKNNLKMRKRLVRSKAPIWSE